MKTLTSLTVVAALLVGGTSLAVAQNGPATGGEPPIAGGAAGGPATPGAATPNNLRAATPSQHATRHHRKLYMSAKGIHHKGTMKAAPSGTQPKMKQQ